MKRNIFSISKKDSGTPLFAAPMPNIRRDDDIFLVSYPKSGNTWISFILANIIIQKLKLDIEVNNFNIHGFIPDIHQGQDIASDLGFFPFKRMIKSHGSFTPLYKNTIYIVRDPRSVLSSYYKFQTGLGLFKGDISTFIRSKNFGVDAWVAHLQGWLDGVTPSMRFRIFRYEDFKKEPAKMIENLAHLIGVTLTEGELDKVISLSSFENMRKLEENTATLSLKKAAKEFRFVRKGEIAGWKEELSEEDTSYICSVAERLMRDFDYL